MNERTRVWLDRRGNNILDGERTMVMGILNVTGDSFYHASRTSVDAALTRAASFIAAGADIIDIGGESTRPGAEPVDADTEIARILPVIRLVREHFPAVRISVDTYKSQTARAALESGADIINDVSAMTFDREMASVVKEYEAPVVLMHMQGAPSTMQSAPVYDDVVREVTAYLSARTSAAVAAGIVRERIAVDPGIGFGKTLAHNLSLIRSIPSLKSIGRPVLVGLSRKRFIGDITGRTVDERLAGSVGAAVAAAMLGADIARVHDVQETHEALMVAEAIANAKTA